MQYLCDWCAIHELEVRVVGVQAHKRFRDVLSDLVNCKYLEKDSLD